MNFNAADILNNLLCFFTLLDRVTMDVNGKVAFSNLKCAKSNIHLNCTVHTSNF